MAPPAEKPAPDDDRSEGVASPDTPEDDEHDEAVATEDEAKASAQDKWAQEQRGVVASLSHENAHLLKAIFLTKLRIVNGGDDGAGEPPPIGVKAHAGLWDLSHAEFNNRVRVIHREEEHGEGC